MPVPLPDPVEVPLASPAFVGRQPIFDRTLAVVGYELLFRMTGHQEQAQIADGDVCTAQVVLNAFLDIGLDRVVDSRWAFVNATRAFLLDRLALQLPPGQTVIEVLETITADAPIVAAVEELRSLGYTVALDDFVFEDPHAPLAGLADIVKVDISRVADGELERYVQRLARPGLRLLAERIETQEEFARCRALGFDYFQGFFLARPTIVHGRRRTSNQLAALRLLSLLQNPDASLDKVVDSISLDPMLSYRLLCVINSAAFGLRRRVDSLKHALVMLGLRRVHGWVTLMVLAGLSDRPPELLSTALIRARMCEVLAEWLGRPRAASYFTVGLFSALDAMLDTSWTTLAGELPLSQDVVAALVDRVGELGEVLVTVLHYERGEWDRVSHPGLSSHDFLEAYLAALEWSRGLVASLDTAA